MADRRHCPHLAERRCVEDQPQRVESAAAGAARTAALREFQVRTLPRPHGS